MKSFGAPASKSLAVDDTLTSSPFLHPLNKSGGKNYGKESSENTVFTSQAIGTNKMLLPIH